MPAYCLLFICILLSIGRVHADTKQVTYCIDPTWVPYEMLRNGKHVGISADYLQIISELADINFILVETESFHQSLEFLQTGRCMVMAMMNSSAYRNVYINFTIPYFESPNVLIARDAKVMYQGLDGLNSQLLGVAKNTFLAEYLARYYPQLRLHLTESEGDGLRALSRGEIDVFAGAMLSVNSEINKMNMSEMAVVGYAEPYNSLRMGVNKAHSEIVEDLNKAIEQIPEAARVEIYKRWSNVKRHYQQDFRMAVLGVACGAVILATLFWRRNIMRRYARELRLKQEEMENLQSVLLEKNRMLEFLSSHDSATNLYNRNFMLHRAEDEVSRFNRFHTAATLILFDFSSQNVRLNPGDSAFSEEGVRELARLCLRSVREVDIAGRWSAEQIIILCPQTPIAASKILADRLKEAIETHPRDDIRLLPFSIGLAALQEGETFADWYERASQALYMARREHSGQVMIAEN
ncbi:hypothetical protein BFC17_10840 [Alteromonas lipolytica]|uniref:diguanylate cyclase n=1 Tax=Alteromonas lipolytica TaxID=1856405 RepID=A0A1E8FIZ1_9ALTE|nr:hypothetical protein BFC17_10840 [Alteromonas lipolytica]